MITFLLFKMNQQVNIFEIFDLLQKCEVYKRYIIYACLLEDMKTNERNVIEHCKNINNQDYLKNLFNLKKETAIENLTTIIPFLKPKNTEAKNLILKILPGFFSYVTLYDTNVQRIFELVDILRVLPAFTQDRNLFEQWFFVFDKRKKHIKRKFAYKDEFYVLDLPSLNSKIETSFHSYIGYSDVALFRCVHRWLRVLRLHKYLFFFANLTYEEILSINESNIHYYESRVNVLELTIGARNKILREIAELKNRPRRLASIIQANLRNTIELEEAARDIKRIMRSPISKKNCSPNLPNLLIEALRKVSDSVGALVDTSEKIIPLYGLVISILKEAYNYSYFSVEQKENFNTWRTYLSGRINKNVLKPRDIFVNVLPTDEYKQREYSKDMTTILDEDTEIIATQMADFVLS